jgi:hypothetical protein
MNTTRTDAVIKGEVRRRRSPVKELQCGQKMPLGGRVGILSRGQPRTFRMF